MIDFIDAARSRWTIQRNYSSNRIKGDSLVGAEVSLGSPHANEITPLSTDPLHPNFMRLDPALMKVRPGDPFPGALPPGPAPAEGDWFTRLQERWRETLQWMPSDVREYWSQPVQMPSYRSVP